jgi:hypothetical protein
VSKLSDDGGAWRDQLIKSAIHAGVGLPRAIDRRSTQQNWDSMWQKLSACIQSQPFLLETNLITTYSASSDALRFPR